MAITNEQLTAAGIDAEGALERFQGNVDYLCQMLGMFVHGNPAQSMQIALESGQQEQVEATFAKIGQNAANLGLVAIAQASDAVLEAQAAGNVELVQQLGATAIARSIQTCNKIKKLG